MTMKFALTPSDVDFENSGQFLSYLLKCINVFHQKHKHFPTLMLVHLIDFDRILSSMYHNPHHGFSKQSLYYLGGNHLCIVTNSYVPLNSFFLTISPELPSWTAVKDSMSENEKNPLIP